MNLIPVEVQLPCKPDSAVTIGEAPDNITAEEVAALVRMPEGCLIDGKIVRSKKKGDRWSLVAWVEVVRRQDERPAMTPAEQSRFTARELATIVAALKLYQRLDAAWELDPSKPHPAMRDDDLRVIFDAWAAEPLSGTAVESLCQRLNLPTPRGKS